VLLSVHYTVLNLYKCNDIRNSADQLLKQFGLWALNTDLNLG